MEVYYICPACNAKCDEHETYCKSCGQWLLSTTHPPKKVVKNKSKNAIFAIVIVLVIAIIGLISSYDQNTIVFDDISNDSFTINQLIVNKKDLTATADITAHENIMDPLEVTASFYDNNGNRLGVASSVLVNPPRQNQTEIINFKFIENNGLKNVVSVRIDISTLSPFELLEKSANLINK